MVAGGVMASGLEGWTFIQGLYWAFQTTTTVGISALPQHSPTVVRVLFIQRME